jgi:hypothetical protein
MSADEFRQQDGQVLFTPEQGYDPHPEWRFTQRVQDDDWTVRAAWRDGDPIDWPGDTYARIHQQTGTLLIAEWGCITTVISLEDAERQSTRELVEDYAEVTDA